MAIDWPRDEVVAAARTHLLRPGAVSDGFAGVEVIARTDTMLVVFRWRRDPNVYAIEVDYPRVAESPMTGEHVESAAEWAQELEWHLASAPFHLMDDAIPRRLLVAGRLACWVRAYSEHGDVLVGQAAASWEDEERTTARVELLYALPATPTEVRYALARDLIVAAAEAGALRVVTAIDDPILHRLGFRASSSGDFTVATTHG